MITGLRPPARASGDRRRRRPLRRRRRCAGCVAARDADLVRPQNYFGPCPGTPAGTRPGPCSTAALGARLSGTLGSPPLRIVGMGGYDGDVLFENLELIRTVRAAAARSTSPLDLYVDACHPTADTSGASGCVRPTTTSRFPRRMARWLPSFRPLSPAAAGGAGGVARLAPAAVLVAESGPPAGGRTGGIPRRRLAAGPALAPGTGRVLLARACATAWRRRRPLRRAPYPPRRALRSHAAAVSPRRAI